jgi:hypothetical protein
MAIIGTYASALKIADAAATIEAASSLKRQARMTLQIRSARV